MILIYDSMSALRARLENQNEPALMLLRGVVNDALRTDRIAVWTWDSPDGSSLRKSIFPGYKNRPPTPNPVLGALSLLKELLAYTPAFQMILPGYEADDLIAAFVTRYHGHPMEIVSRDGDLAALGVPCNARVINRWQEGEERKSEGVPADLIPLYKLTVGDKSDTIPGLDGFGPSAWAKADKVALWQIINAICDEGRPMLDSWETRSRAAGLGTRSIKWLKVQQNVDQLCAMRRVIAPQPLTDDQFQQALTRGADNPAAREAILSRLML